MNINSGSEWSQEKRERSYLFIDGGHLRVLSRETIAKVFPGTSPQIDHARLLETIPCSKAFYYDCIDELRKDEDPGAFAAREKMQQDEFSGIRALAGFHVVEGTLSDGKRQKEIDVALAVDMLTHAFNRNIGWAHLITGDLDFRPLVHALVRLGVYVTVWSQTPSAAKPLLWAADHYRDLNFKMLWGWCTADFQKANPLPLMMPDHEPLGAAQMVREGKYSGGFVALYREPSNEYFIRSLDNVPHNTPFRVRHCLRSVLEDYFELEYGHVEWTTSKSPKPNKRIDLPGRFGA